MKCEICNKSNTVIVSKFQNNFTVKQNLILFSTTFFNFIPNIFLEKGRPILSKSINHIIDRILNVKTLSKNFKNKKWLKCKECELIFIDPPMSEEALNDIYQEAFWGKALVTNSFLTENINYEPRIIEQFNFIKDFLPSIDGNFLDFGAGNCQATFFSREFFSIQNNIVVDVSSQTKALCDKLNFKYHDYSNLNNAKEIDFFFSSHSIEHLRSLKDFMENLSIILSKQSHVFVEVPYLIEENDLNVYSHAPHTMFFNKKSLVSAFEKYGLKLFSPKSIIYVEEQACIRALFYKA